MAKDKQNKEQHEFLFLIDFNASASTTKVNTYNLKENFLSSSTFDEGEAASLKQKLITQLKENGC